MRCRPGGRGPGQKSVGLTHHIGSLERPLLRHHLGPKGEGGGPVGLQAGWQPGERVTTVGTLCGFAEAAEKVLPKMAAFRVSASTVVRTTETVGSDVGKRLAAEGQRVDMVLVFAAGNGGRPGRMICIVCGRYS